MNKRILALPLLALLFFNLEGLAVPAESPLLSPDGRVEVRLGVKEMGRPYDPGARFYYSVVFNGKQLLTDSPFGLEFRDMPPFGEGIEVTGVERMEVKESYRDPFSKSSEVINHCNEIKFTLKERTGNGRMIDVNFRAYDDGVAFRYSFPEQPSFKNFRITGELSTFHFTGNHEVYVSTQERFVVESAWQEMYYDRKKLKNLKSAHFIIPPLVVKAADDAWAAVMEADLTDYAGLFMCGRKKFPFAIEAKLSPRQDDKGVLVNARTPHVSPWRVVMLGEKPGDLIESNLLINLNDPPVIGDVSWIRPGKAAWTWWCNNYIPDAGFETGYNNETMKHFMDFAGEMGFECMLIDEGWYAGDDITRMNGTIDIPYLVEYGKNMGVDVILWARWSSVDKQMDEAFPLYRSWGVRGVKVDFMERNDQEMVSFYHRTLKKAIENRLTVNFHGAYVPTGIRRTYPNLITREAVRGNEYNKFDDTINSKHILTIPFTRMLCGPLDFTPGSFSNVTDRNFWPNYDRPVTIGTRCAQIAMFVVYESPFQSLCDAPANYRNQPGLEFLKVVPTVWDETRVIEGSVGEYIVIARRHGDDWFIGSMTDKTPRTLEIPLAFLGEGGYRARIFSDGENAAKKPTQVDVREISVTSKDVIKAAMASGGGQAVHIYPE